jgi:peptidoglycan/LPS O-acetylase OafA/YrhL
MLLAFLSPLERHARSALALDTLTPTNQSSSPLLLGAILNISDKSNPNHCYWLDWLRFLAAVAVLVAHTRSNTWTKFGELDDSARTLASVFFFAITRGGHQAVLLFFVLSGYLIGGKVIEQCLAKRFSPAHYAIDRLTRLWVPMLPVLVLTLGVEWFITGQLPLLRGLLHLVGWQAVSPNYALTTNEPLWTLAYEGWLYLLAGALGMLTLANARWLGLLLVLLCLWVFLRLDWVMQVAWWLGAFAYQLHLGFRWRWTALALTLVSLILSELTSQSQSLIPLPIPEAIGSLALATSLAALIAALAHWSPQTPVAVKLEQLGTNLASWSYSLYLSHYLVLVMFSHFVGQLYSSFTAKSFLLFSTQIIVAVLLAKLIYYLFESRTGVVRRWLKLRWRVSIVRALP